MTSTSSTPRSRRRRPLKERRKQPGEPGSMRWLGGILGRPLALESGTIGPRVVLVERRKAGEPTDGVAIGPICDELRARLLDQQRADATRVMRHLALVHDQLAAKGWSGLDRLSSQALGMAVVQAQMLAADEPSLRLAELTDRLRVIKVEVELREERQRVAVAEGQVEVSEVPHEEFTRSTVDWQASQLQPESLPPGQR